MNAERAREFLRSLPHVIEAEQFGGLIYWVGDKAIGGRMCAMLNFEGVAGTPATFPVGIERFADLCEQEGIVPARYLARIFWISVERWDVLRNNEWEDEFRAAHLLTYTKLPPKTKAILAMPKTEQKKIVAAHGKALAAREAAKKQAKAQQRKDKIAVKPPP